MSTLQILGTVMAIPAAIGSAYSMYRTNFSADATCHSLRANIIQILDKSVDASARHMLVRRDVEAFEQRCGDVDPDAAAAFKTLLAADKGKAPAVQPVVAQSKPVERKIEPKIDTKTEAKAEPKAEPKTETKTQPRQEAAKQPAAKSAVAAVAPVQRDPATSDAAWLEAVRGALVNHVPEAAPAEAVAAPAANAKAVEAKAADTKPIETKAAVAAPVLRPAVPDIQPPMPQSAWSAPVAEPAPTPAVAGALPPPAVVANAPAPQAQTAQADDGHPVPPGAIPDAPPTDITPVENGSRIGALISHIPFVGGALSR
jgi:hypothetical protein